MPASEIAFDQHDQRLEHFRGKRDWRVVSEQLPFDDGQAKGTELVRRGVRAHRGRGRADSSRADGCQKLSRFLQDLSPDRLVESTRSTHRGRATQKEGV